jgi:Topoisomerase 6 subunit A/Spo11, Toprim domain
MIKKPQRPRNISNDILDVVETATRPWTRQRKAEERHPGLVRYRASRMTREPRTTQKGATWQVLEEAYNRASSNGRLPAKVRQIFYQARPKIMELTEDKHLDYGYFSQTLVPNYIEENGVAWNVVYDARGHFEEPHTNRCMGCGTIEVRNYLRAMRRPQIEAARLLNANVNVIGPSGNIAGVLYCEKEGFDPLFKDVDLANRYDLMVISNKGVSVTAARELVSRLCGTLPLFVLHDFDVAGFMILGTLHRSTRRYQFSGSINLVDLGLRLEDIDGLEQEPAAATKTGQGKLRAQLERNGATAAEIEILLDDRVELNAMTSDALIEMIERKLQGYGLQKVIPSDDLLDEAYQEFHRSSELQEKFEEMEEDFKETEIATPKNLRKRIAAILKKHPELRWDDAIKVVLNKTQLADVRAAKQEAKREAGNFMGDDTDDGDDAA